MFFHPRTVSFSQPDIFVGTCPYISLSYGSVRFDTDPDPRRGPYPINTTATFICNYGDPVLGDDSATCQETGNWSQFVPTCTGNKYNSKIIKE